MDLIIYMDYVPCETPLTHIFLASSECSHTRSHDSSVKIYLRHILTKSMCRAFLLNINYKNDIIYRKERHFGLSWLSEAFMMLLSILSGLRALD